MLCSHKNKKGMSILISDKTDLRTKNIIRDKERHHVMIRGPIRPEGIHNDSKCSCINYN